MSTMLKTWQRLYLLSSTIENCSYKLRQSLSSTSTRKQTKHNFWGRQNSGRIINSHSVVTAQGKLTKKRHFQGTLVSSTYYSSKPMCSWRCSMARAAVEWNPQGKWKRGRPMQSWRHTQVIELKEKDVTWAAANKSAQNRITSRWKVMVTDLHVCSAWN